MVCIEDMDVIARGDLTGLNVGLEKEHGREGRDGRRSVLKSGRWSLDTDILALRCESHFGAGGICLFWVNLLVNLEKVARRGEIVGPKEVVGDVGAWSVSSDLRPKSFGVGDSACRPKEAMVEMRISL
jgi:hypothetical protein